jgi:cell division septum initiation protein DivIVA
MPGARWGGRARHCLGSRGGLTVNQSVGGTLTANQHRAISEVGISGAARLLEIATRNADELLDEARAEAASITAVAHADAERVRAELERMRREHNDELDRHGATVLADLAERRAALEAEVARLEQLGQQSRARMRGYLTEQLAQLESTPGPEVRRTSTV